jgi:hypothetical protein
MEADSAVHLLNEGLAALRPRIDQLETQKLLIELAACTAEAQLTSLVAAAQWIRDDYPRALTLIRLARNAKGAPDLVRAAFDSAAALPNEGWRASAIAELAPALPDDLLPSCLRLVQAMRAHDPKTIALSALAARSPVLAGLPPVSSLLADVSRMSHEQWRAEAQINLAEVLDSRPRVDALRVALLQIARLPSWNREPLFGRALAVWASCGFADGSVTASRILADTINAIEGETRTFLLASAAMLTPVLAHVGGVDSVREGLQSVESVARWWP